MSYLFSQGLCADLRVKTVLNMLLIVIAATIPWMIQFAVNYVQGVAISEAVSALSVSAWAIVMKITMLRETSKTSN